ncbi:M23 family metallopeptidase [Gilvimarinus algae]|uniref:M23 family metallopeptidase n=1 Tax=Gilvimarinus algae TaxID=3058037 RepID=A0ABT8TKB8_9GAMM|nr:M23 family metallopeptidase [Gilvimarinus sp. SDUM040014]MDO3382812.1 M23 family metallopeptidase [Gilvimarinus sp. SDUM040014]
MKIILVSKRHGHARSITLGGWTRAVLSVCILGLPAVAGVLGYHLLVAQAGHEMFTAESRRAWEVALAEQKEQVTESRKRARAEVAALTLKVAELQARLVRLDALGERLTTIAKLDSGEFDFSQSPAVGGPEGDALGEAYSPPDFLTAIDELSRQIENREQQLETLDTLLVNRRLKEDIFVAGRPVEKGWMSSRFGRRTDPFTGKVAWHGGVDFAGKDGSNIIAVASGVVTWSGDRSGYGQMVEISHGNGFSTRYAHNKENSVDVGDVVKKGQVIALMGSTGRSTGPHVHFEVYKNGRAVDPSSYIHRTLR